MKVQALTNERVNDFRNYFLRYAIEQDESWPPSESYKVREDEPVYLLVDDSDSIVGVAALMLHEEYIQSKQGRFRIFHCIEKNEENYRVLLDEILKHTKPVEKITAFIEDFRVDTTEIWSKLGSVPVSYSWILQRKVKGCEPPKFNNKFEIKTMLSGEEQIWCDVVNKAFSANKFALPVTPKVIDEWRLDSGYIPEGMKILWNGSLPVGAVALVKETEDGEDVIFIEYISVIPELQGQGIGRNILRYGVEFTGNNGIKNAMLSVNAKNKTAADLYINEGFEKVTTYVCYSFNVHLNNN